MPLSPAVSHLLLWTLMSVVAVTVYAVGLWAERRTGGRCVHEQCVRHRSLRQRTEAALWLERSVGSQTWRDR